MGARVHARPEVGARTWLVDVRGNRGKAVIRIKKAINMTEMFMTVILMIRMMLVITAMRMEFVIISR